MQQPFSSIALAPRGDLQQFLIKPLNSWCGLWKELLSFYVSILFFFCPSLGLYNTLLRGSWRTLFIFHTFDHNKISAIHTDELWDMVNRWRGLWCQWAVLLQSWPVRFKTLVLSDYWHHPCADNYHPLSQTAQISQQHTAVIPDSFVSVFFNSGILIRASDNICHS